MTHPTAQALMATALQVAAERPEGQDNVERMLTAVLDITNALEDSLSENERLKLELAQLQQRIEAAGTRLG